jgi:hypothetical protein
VKDRDRFSAIGEFEETGKAALESSAPKGGLSEELHLRPSLFTVDGDQRRNAQEAL